MAALQGAGTPASTVFVGNLAYDLSEQDVIDYFGKVGPVKAIRIVTERDSGKPRGFGFVEYYDVPTAESCIRNLSGSDLNGRVIRIVFAEGGPGDFRPRPDEREQGGQGRSDERSRRSAFARGKLVGADLAYHSSQGMSVLLGQAPKQGGGSADALTVLLARKTRSELYEYLVQMQSLLHQNPQQARQVLLDNPQLARALFHMEIILGMVSNPLGDIAPKGVAPPGILPPKHFDSDQQHHHHHHQQQQQQNYYHPSEPTDRGERGGAIPLDPRIAAATAAATAPMDPRLAGAIAPMAPMAPAPRPMVSAAVGGGLPSAVAPGGVLPGAAVPGMNSDQQQALLQQVMSLTPEQIELLPPQQKAQVLALQQQLRGQ